MKEAEEGVTTHANKESFLLGRSLLLFMKTCTRTHSNQSRQYFSSDINNEGTGDCKIGWNIVPVHPNNENIVFCLQKFVNRLCSYG